MKLNFTKPVRTSGGYPVTILATNARGNFPVIGYIDQLKKISRWTINGELHGPKNPSKFDLVQQEEVC